MRLVSIEAVVVGVAVVCLTVVIAILMASRKSIGDLFLQTKKVEEVVHIDRTATSPIIESVTSESESKENVVVRADRLKPKKRGPRKKNWAEKGQALLETGDLDLAIGALNKAVALNDKDFDSLFCRSRAFFKKFELNCNCESTLEVASRYLLLSLQDADACITLKPNREEGYGCKITVLLGINELREALTVCREGIRRVPDSSLLKTSEAKIRRAASPAGKLERLLQQKRQDEIEYSKNPPTSYHAHASLDCSGTRSGSSVCSASTVETAPQTVLHAPSHIHSHSERCGDTCPQPKCATCGSVGAVKACGRCRKVWYCGKGCQRLHLKAHKDVCKAPTALTS